MTRLLVTLIVISTTVGACGAGSLPRLNVAPQSVEQLWAGYDPRFEPLEVQVVREFQEDDLTLRYVIYSIGASKGKPARMAAFYGFPTEGKKLPAVMHMHGGEVPRFFELRWTGGKPVRRRKPYLSSTRCAAGGLDNTEFEQAIEDSIRREQIDNDG